MLNFTVGPVQAEEAVRQIGYEQVPYFRTPEFSQLMLENEEMMLELTHAPENAKVVFLTGSGSAAMEAAVMNTLTPDDKVLVVNGGSFGQRFVDILTLHQIPFTEIKMTVGQKLTREMLAPFAGHGYTGFLVNVHETSTGVHYDMPMIGEFCRENDLFLIADNISSFLADDFNMAEIGADIMLTGSQKALACAPGISVLVLDEKALNRVAGHETKCMYLDLKSALKNAERGQTPFTPAVGILRQIHTRLKNIQAAGGIDQEVARTAALANYFREQIQELPFEYVSESMSNGMTSLHPTTASAKDIFTILKDEYQIWVCPNGGALGEKIFRVGHIGDLTKADYDTLLAAFRDLQKRGII